MTTSRPQRADPAPGFTLVEMLVALAISAVVIAGGVALLMSQERMFRTTSGARSLQETARVALGDLAASLRRAGYGVDPGVALDFGPTLYVQGQAAPIAGLTPRNPGYLCNTPVTCRDSITGPDEIVFLSRDPLFGHTVKSADASSLTLAGPVPVPLYKGQVLQVMCLRGDQLWAYVTVGATTAASATDVVVSLANGKDLEFGGQNSSLTDPSVGSECFRDGTAWVSKIDRFHYYVQNYSDAGKPVAATDVGARPFLMLDQGLSDKDQAITTVVAQDVEDVQFAYLFPRQPSAFQLVGGPVDGATGTVINAGVGGIDLAAAGSGYGVADADAVRNTWHPSNLRAVRISVVVRTPTQDDKIADAKVPAAANRPEIDGPAGYRRQRFDTTVSLPNMDARAPFFPYHATNPGDRFNFGGS